MAELQNVFTKGTEGIHTPGDPDRSEIFMPVNEDWAMVVKVKSVSNGVVEGVKVWDMGEPGKSYYAWLKYLGQAGTPPDISLRIGEYVVFYRVGNYNAQGPFNSFAKDNDLPDAASFVCFVGYYPTILVRDKGNGNGEEVVVNSLNQIVVPEGSETLPMYPLDPTTQFHNSTPPWANGRIYAGQKFETATGFRYYRVWLPGFGDTTKEWLIAAGNFTFQLQCDNSGHIKNFTVIES
ncbi:MAG TPA: hypothetical protein ENF45_03830 [Bacteroidetes bacterium]|nr:hypothetical protein [Bacteroidota bacterium]